MKILHVSSEYPPAKIYGLGRFVHGLARAQAAAGDEVHVLTNSTGGAEDDVVLDGVHVHRIAFPNPPRPPDGHGEVLQFNHGLVARFLDRIERFRDVDVVVGHDWLTAIAAREIAAELGRALVTTFHDEIVGKRFGILRAEDRFVRDLEALAAHDATRVIANSTYIAREIVRHYGVPADRVRAVHGGIDPAILAVAAEHRAPDFRSALADPGEILFGYVGRFDAEKGLDLLAEAAAEVGRAEPRIRFALAGSGALETQVREMLAPLGPRARLLGYLKGETLAYFYRACDVVAVPSIYEPFGLVALEAMLAGAAVVVSNAGGLSEVVRDGENGLVVPAGDPRALAHALVRLARDGSLRDRLRRAGKERAGSDFAWPAVARQTRTVYEEAACDARPVVTVAPTAPTRPLVSVTIATFNAPAHLEATLGSLFGRTTYRPIEAIVVDNGSAPVAVARTEAVIGELRARGAEITLVRNETNRFFSAAQNRAIALARGEYVCVLNDDAEVPPGSEHWLDALVWQLEQPGVGTVTPVTLARDGRIYCAGAFGSGGHHLRDVADGPGVAMAPRRAEWNSMACLLTRRRYFQEVGGLREDQPYAQSEGDREWCLRLGKKLGLGHWVHPVRLFHFEKEAQRDPTISFAATADTRIPASIVVVAYNGLRFNRECVDSILAGSEPPLELVIVDNGSTDGSREFFRSVRDQLGGRIAVQLVENRENRGYTVAANQGGRAARGRHVVLLNNDTRVRPGWLRALLDAASAPKIGVVTAKTLNLDGTVQSAGGILHHPDGSFTIPHASEDHLAPSVSKRRDVENAGGPCMLLTRMLIERVGLFDEAFNPGYFEDSDLCLRAREAGLRLVYEPGAEVIHHGKATSSVVASEGRVDIWRRFEENKRRFHKRWGPRLATDHAGRPGATPPAEPRRRRVYDGFTFFNELDVLEIRLEELESVVDVFVLVESTRTFSNQPKPLVFAENRARFKRFGDRIRHVVVDDMPPHPRSPWDLERFQRNAILRGLGDAQPDDLVMISDVDEIPRATRVAAFNGDGAGLEQTSFYYSLNCRNVRGQEPRAWSIILRRRLLGKPEEARMGRFDLPLIRDGGWHFSYLGGSEAIRRKIAAFSHQELNVEEFTSVERIRARIVEGRDLFERPGLEWRYVPLDASFPHCITERPGRWKHLLEDVEQGSVAEVSR